MMSMQQLSDVLNGQLVGDDIYFSNVSTDTRSLNEGDLYIALQGERFDGHDYLDQAKQAGAVAAVVAKDIETTLPYIKVEDTRKALGGLAAAWRTSFDGKVIGVTGSNGKTTVKEMIAAILAKQGGVLATQGNFNNDIGLPLTLLRMDKEQFAVIEMGANHAGEIQYLTGLTQPDIAVITNAGPAHLEGFGSLKGVAEAKGEIYQGLNQQGVAVINRDDNFAEYWLGICKEHRVCTFSLKSSEADVYGEWSPTDSGGLIECQVGDQSFNVLLNVFGEHNAANALAAISVAHSLGISGDSIKAGLQNFEAVDGRLSAKRLNEKLVILDDTYNANPASLSAGIKVLNDFSGEHWLILGDMGELGDDERRLHFDAGVKARTLGVSRLLAVGDASQHAVDAFGENAYFFESKDELVKHIENNHPEELGILIKGSRFMQMEQIVESLIERLS